DDLLRMDLEGHVVHRDKPAEALRDMFDGQERAHVASFFAVGSSSTIAAVASCGRRRSPPRATMPRRESRPRIPPGSNRMMKMSSAPKISRFTATRFGSDSTIWRTGK